MCQWLLGATLAVVPWLVMLASSAGAQEATPASTADEPKPTVETVLDASTDALPQGHRVVALDRWRLQPGSPALDVPAMNGLLVLALESGEVTVETEGNEQVLVAGVPLIVPPDASFTLRNAGSGEATFFAAYVFAGFEDTGPWFSDPVTHHVDYLISTSADALPGGPAQIVVERLTLPPGGAMPPEMAASLLWTEVGSGAASLMLEGEGLPFRWDSGEERTFRQGQYLPAIRPGTTMTFRNAGDGPLVLYRLRLVPDSGIGTAVAGTPVG